jgi:hypothetical protein
VIVGVHQPHFLPWIGYMNKLLHCDAFVWLDSVQYRKNYFQNRTPIRTHRGERAWLTLPVHAPFGITIDQVTIAEPRWRDRVRKRVEQEYSRAPFFSECWSVIDTALVEASEALADVNLRTLQSILELLGCKRPQIVPIRDLGVSSSDPTGRLVEACKALGATRYVAGRGGRRYLSVEEFERAGIEIVWQDCNVESVRYPQPGDVFIPGLSIIDCLFNVGATPARELVAAAWVPQVSST